MTVANINTGLASVSIDIPDYLYFSLMDMVREEGLDSISDAVRLLLIRS